MSHENNEDKHDITEDDNDNDDDSYDDDDSDVGDNDDDDAKEGGGGKFLCQVSLSKTSCSHLTTWSSLDFHSTTIFCHFYILCISC